MGRPLECVVSYYNGFIIVMNTKSIVKLSITIPTITTTTIDITDSDSTIIPTALFTITIKLSTTQFIIIQFTIPTSIIYYIINNNGDNHIMVFQSKTIFSRKLIVGIFIFIYILREFSVIVNITIIQNLQSTF